MCTPGAVTAVAAAEPSDIPPAVAPGIARLREALASPEVDDTAKAAIEALLTQAAADDRAADEALEKAAALRSEAARPSADRPPKAPMDTAEEFRIWQARLPPGEPLDALEKRLTDARQELERLHQALSAANAGLSELLSAPATLTEDLALHRGLVEERRAATPPSGDADPLVQARGLAAVAALRRALAGQERLEALQETLPARQGQLETRRRQLNRDLSLAEQRVDFLQARVRELRKNMAEARRTLLLSEQAEYDRAPAAVQRLAAENVALVDSLIALDAELANRRAAAAAAAAAVADVESALRGAESRLAVSGSGGAVGLVLLRERQRLAEPTRLQRRLGEVQRSFAAAHLRLIDLSERATQLDDLPAAVREAMKLPGVDEDGEESHDLHAAFTQLLRTQAGLLPELADTTRQLARALGDEERALQAQIRATTALMDLLDRRLLWIPTHDPVDGTWLRRHPAGWADLVKPARFAYSGRLLATAVLDRWALVAMFLLLVGGALVWRRRLPARLEQWAPRVRQLRTDRFAWTMECLVVTLIAAAPPALAVWGLGWLLQNAGEAGKFTHSLGRAVAAVTPTVYVASFLYWLTSDHGLARVHLRWPRPRRTALRALHPWLVAVFVPIQLAVNLAFIRELEPARDTAGRDLVVLWCLFSAWVTWHLLAPGTALADRSGNDTNNGLRRVLRVSLPKAEAIKPRKISVG